MDPIIVASLLEIGKLGLQAYLQTMELAGKTEAEIEEVYQREKAKFKENKPELLPDPQ